MQGPLTLLRPAFHLQPPGLYQAENALHSSVPFDPALALRVLNNDRLRGALDDDRDIRDIGGALVTIADWSAIADLNCLKDFTSNDRHIESLFDIGFALLRAFDREPAARVGPLDRPKSLTKRLQERRMEIVSRRSWMVLRDDPPRIDVNRDVEVRTATHEDVSTFAAIHSAGEKWARKMSVSSTLGGMRRGGNSYYLGYLEGQAVATQHLLIDGRTAGIYALATTRPYRRRGSCSTLVARAIDDAYAAGCDVVCLSTELGGAPERLYEKLGFEPVFQSETWAAQT
jgi:GNAT superfamily N-acetyltransferase